MRISQRLWLCSRPAGADIAEVSKQNAVLCVSKGTCCPQMRGSGKAISRCAKRYKQSTVRKEMAILCEGLSQAWTINDVPEDFCSLHASKTERKMTELTSP